MAGSSSAPAPRGGRGLRRTMRVSWPRRRVFFALFPPSPRALPRLFSPFIFPPPPPPAAAAAFFCLSDCRARAGPLSVCAAAVGERARCRSAGPSRRSMARPPRRRPPAPEPRPAAPPAPPAGPRPAAPPPWAASRRPERQVGPRQPRAPLASRRASRSVFSPRLLLC